MPLLIMLFNGIIVIPFMIHVLKTGQDRYWIMILLMAPFIGALLYFLTIILPTLRNTRHGYKLENQLRKHLNPNGDLKAALNEYELSRTPANTLNLADAFANNGRYEESLPVYEEALSGIYEQDPDILEKYAKACFLAGQPQQCLNILDRLREHNPNYNAPEGHLYYAKALAACGKTIEARAEYEVLVQYYSGFEAKVCYAELLIQIGEQSQARKILEDLLIFSQRTQPHVRELNRESIKRAKNLLKQLTP